MPTESVLASVLAYTRAGALSEARRCFREAGLEDVRGDPVVVAMRGRLLREEAMASVGRARTDFLRQAAEAYGAAGVLSAASDHLIESAGLWRLLGEPQAAEPLASAALDGLDRRTDGGEASYGLAAARAEALLLLGRTARARAALAEATRLAPRAWEDHATTLRRLRPLAEAMDVDAGWIETLRPPPGLHFTGHMSLAAGVPDLRRRVREVLDSEAPGFATGSLVAGADIDVAEELLAAGVELNLLLPAHPADFRAAWAARQGPDWAPRYDAVLDAAASVRSVGEGTAAPAALSVQLAAEVAMGETAMRATRLETEAVQLLVLDLDERGDEPGGSGWARALWAGGGRRQAVILAERERRAAPPVPAAAPGDRLMALLAVAVEADDVPALAQALRQVPPPPAPPSWRAGVFRLSYDAARPAGEAARAVREALGPLARIAGHYGVVASTALPGAIRPVAMGQAVELPEPILSSTPPGACLLTRPFAAAVCAADARQRVEPAGDAFGPPSDLFALRS